MFRQLKVAHDTAVKGRAATMVTLKAMLIHAPEHIRWETTSMTQIKLARHLAALRPRQLETPDDSIRYTLRTLAKRWHFLDTEARELSTMIEDLVMRTAPHLVEPFGIGVDTAAEILTVVGDNPERIKSEAAFAKLAGISPVPAGSGMTSGKH
jgi:transposase